MADAVAIGGTLVDPEWIINDDDIRSINAALSSTLICDRMDYDVLTAAVHLPQPTSRAAIPTSVPYGTPIWWVHNGDLIGKLYAKSWVRTGPSDYTLEAVSAVGILDNIRHYGGIYTGQSVADVLGDIIGNHFAYTVAEDLAAVTVYGWLPISSARENLHQLLFAEGAQIVKDVTGEMIFQFPDAETTVPISPSRVYMGGSVDFGSPASGVEITEHAFFASDLDLEATLFDNTGGTAETADHLLVSFEQPCHGLIATEGLNINSSGANYAIVSGTGVLTGYAYTHTTNVVRADSDAANVATNIVSVEGAYLVSALNSERVMARVLSYYAAARKLTADINLTTEQPGMQVSLVNAFREPDGGFISDMELQASSIIKATCSIISGYNPSGGGNNYNRSITLTGAGKWTIPQGAAKIRVALIGGGTGGSGGQNGENGGNGSSSRNGTGGAGGAGGAGGQPGKVYVVTFNVTAGQVIDYACGEGGVGGAAGAPGAPGGASTFGAYSSESGGVLQGGFVDIITGEVYAAPIATEGVPGGSGNYNGGQSVAYDGILWQVGPYGKTVSNYDCVAGGGGGGGACAGKNGGGGLNGRVVLNPNGTTYAEGGYGGQGASPDPRAASTIYGTGGDGGHGGGGGGGSGGATGGTAGSWPYNPGSGGTGGTGGDGAPGCIIIYY